jgi:hypothetical protein
VALGDVNSDGYLDAVFANETQPNSVCFGDGYGGFTCSNVNSDSLRSQDVALGDFNGDGNIDAMFANSISAISMHNRVCLGDGAGAFACADAGPDERGSQGVALGDLNGDGKLDAAFANLQPQRNQACFGDGTGGFVCTDANTHTTNSTGVAILPISSTAGSPAHNCVGFESPMAEYPVKAKKNRAFPLKMELFDSDGFELTETQIAAPPVVQVMFTAEGGATAIDVSDDVLSSGQGSEGNQFAFTEEGIWQFNLKSSSYTAPGIYLVMAVSGDESEYVIEPACVTSFVIE